MNILVVSEAFVGGGLETHIHTYYRELKEQHNFYFAFGLFKNRLPIDETHVDASFHFKREGTISEFIEDVDHLVEVIREKKIDVIHAHPFFSLFPSLVASQLTGVPVAMTYHGIASFSFTNRIMDTIWYYYGMYELFGKIFAVSEVGKTALARQFHRQDICFLPNAVDVNQYKQHKVIKNRRWAAISRLDADNGKEEALISLFQMLPKLNIDHIDIYGDGIRKQALMDYVKEHHLTKQITFQGFQSDLYTRLDGKYNGIIGTDRVAIEGLSMGYPVMEMGYGRVIGIIDQEMIGSLATTNFDANLMPEIPSADALNDMLRMVYEAPDRFNMRAVIEKEFNSKSISNSYIDELSTSKFLPHANVVEFYKALCAIEDKDQGMWNSDVVFTLMRKQIEYYAVSSDIKILFLIHQQEQLITAVMNNHVNGLNWRIDQVKADENVGLRTINSQKNTGADYIRKGVNKVKRIIKAAARRIK